MMDPAGHPDCPLEPREKRKIQFAVPATEPTQLDPRQVEMIRRRRPTPATLFRVSEQTSPEDDASCHQWVVGENGVLKPKRINTSVYQPPSLKAVQQMAEAHMQESGAQLEEEEHKGEEHEWEEHEDPVRVRREFSCSSDPAEQNPEKQSDARASDTTEEEEEERDEDLH